MQPRWGCLPTGWRDSQCPTPCCASPHLGSCFMGPKTVSPPPDLGGPHHSGFGSEVCQCACFFELMLKYLDLPFLSLSVSLREAKMPSASLRALLYSHLQWAQLSQVI